MYVLGCPDPKTLQEATVRVCVLCSLQELAELHSAVQALQQSLDSMASPVLQVSRLPHTKLGVSCAVMCFPDPGGAGESQDSRLW